MLYNTNGRCKTDTICLAILIAQVIVATFMVAGLKMIVLVLKIFVRAREQLS